MKKVIVNSFLLILIIVSGTSFKQTSSSFLPTSLKITVLTDLGNPSEGAVVTLYKTKVDYKAEKNPVDEKIADDSGKVVFKKLEPIPYYVHAVNGKMNNNGAGVLTEELQEGKTNRVNTIIE